MLSSRSLAILLLALVLTGAVWLARGLLLPYGDYPQPKLLTIAPLTSRWQISRQLARAGVIRSAAAFDLWSSVRPGETLKAGAYRFDRPAGGITVFRRLVRGDVFFFTFTVPEGFNRFEIAQSLERQKIASGAAFLAATQSPRLIRDLDPAAVSLEGYLFPDTYRIEPGTSAGQIAALMVARFRQVLHREDWPRVKPHDNSTPPRPVSLHEWVTIASLVEKESALQPERRVIAGVFYNRLAQGLLLQCDPTVIYAALLAGQWSGTIHQPDLRRKSPYNTYVSAGLPPGPIANPGLAALKAAADPAHTPYLYFVSNGKGAHRFARTLGEQDHNIRLYLHHKASGEASAAASARRRKGVPGPHAH